MRAFIATLLLCLFSLSQAQARSAHSHHGHHHAVRVAKVLQPDFSYPVDDRYSYMNKGEWVYHETGPKARFDWQRQSRREVRKTSYASVEPITVSTSRPSDCYGIPWCGCFMRHLLGVADKSFNLARRWASYGSASSPIPGAVVVWNHHVGKLIRQVSGNIWIVLSGNDGHQVRERPRSIGNAIAIRA